MRTGDGRKEERSGLSPHLSSVADLSQTTSAAWRLVIYKSEMGQIENEKKYLVREARTSPPSGRCGGLSLEARPGLLFRPVQVWRWKPWSRKSLPSSSHPPLMWQRDRATCFGNERRTLRDAVQWGWGRAKFMSHFGVGRTKTSTEFRRQNRRTNHSWQSRDWLPSWCIS